MLDELDEKMNSSPRFDDGNFPTDYSSVKSYLTCPYSYKLSAIYGYNAAVPELLALARQAILHWKDCISVLRIIPLQKKMFVLLLKIHLC